MLEGAYFKEHCLFEGERYVHGSEVSTSTKCLQCQDGEWVTSLMAERERDFVDWL